MDKYLTIDIIADALASAYMHGGFSQFMKSAQQIVAGAPGYEHLPGRTLGVATVMGHALRGKLGMVSIQLDGHEVGQLKEMRDKLHG